MRFKQILRKDDTQDPVLIDKISKRWLTRFMKDKRISLQRKTNRKGKSVYQRLHQISNYHHFVIYKMANPEYDYPVWKNNELEAIDFGDDEDESEEEYDTDSDSEDTEEWTE